MSDPIAPTPETAANDHLGRGRAVTALRWLAYPVGCAIAVDIVVVTAERVASNGDPFDIFGCVD